MIKHGRQEDGRLFAEVWMDGSKKEGFRFWAEGNKLAVQQDGKSEVKRIQVIEDPKGEYTYSVQKTRIKAAEGMTGFYRFLSREVTDPQTPFISPVIRILEHVTEHGKQ